MRQGLAIAVVTGAAFAGAAAADIGDASLTPRERKAIAASGLPKAAVVSVKPDMVVAIRNRGVVSEGGGVVEGVALQGEVTSPVAAQFLGYQSMRSTVNVDCVRRRDMVVKMTVFTEPRGKGIAVNRHVPGGWVQPSPDAYLADVIRSVCASVPRMAAAPVQPALGAMEAQEVEEERPLRTSIDARAARSQIVSVAAPDPAPTAPPRAKVIADDPPAPALRLVAEATAVAPAVAPLPAAPQPALKPAAPKPPPKPMVAKPGKVAVQVAAADSERQAKEALAKLRGRISPPLSTQVTPVVVDGRTFHRALVVGFQTRAQAQAFCAPLKGGCFIR